MVDENGILVPKCSLMSSMLILIYNDIFSFAKLLKGISKNQTLQHEPRIIPIKSKAKSIREVIIRGSLKGNNHFLQGRTQNKERWGDVNHGTWYTPWDIYIIKRLYEVQPNSKPDYTPNGRDDRW